MTTCNGCGSDDGIGTSACSHCPDCPPTPCDECGGLNDWAARTYCACWVDVADLAPADLKALLADDCDGPGLSLEVTR